MPISIDSKTFSSRLVHGLAHAILGAAILSAAEASERAADTHGWKLLIVNIGCVFVACEWVANSIIKLDRIEKW